MCVIKPFPRLGPSDRRVLGLRSDQTNIKRSRSTRGRTLRRTRRPLTVVVAAPTCFLIASWTHRLALVSTLSGVRRCPRRCNRFCDQLSPKIEIVQRTNLPFGVISCHFPQSRRSPREACRLIKWCDVSPGGTWSASKSKGTFNYRLVLTLEIVFRTPMAQPFPTLLGTTFQLVSENRGVGNRIAVGASPKSSLQPNAGI